jgi:hypothetical protein
MEKTEQKEQKWGFWLYMLNFFNLDSIGRLLIRRILNSDETAFSHHLISFVIATSLTFAIFYAFRYYSWKFKVWTTCAILVIWLLVRILNARTKPANSMGYGVSIQSSYFSVHRSWPFSAF